MASAVAHGPTVGGDAKTRAWGYPLLVASGLGYPLTQAVIARWGRPGASVVAAVSGGLAMRDAALIAGGTPHRLRGLPAVLLWVEACAAAVALATGLRAVAAPPTTLRSGPLELARRGAIGVLFGLHTWRFWMYLQPGGGRKAIGR